MTARYSKRYALIYYNFQVKWEVKRCNYCLQFMATRVKYSIIVSAYTPCQNFMDTLAYNKTLYKIICQNEKFIHLTSSTFISLY